MCYGAEKPTAIRASAGRRNLRRCAGACLVFAIAPLLGLPKTARARQAEDDPVFVGRSALNLCDSAAASEDREAAEVAAAIAEAAAAAPSRAREPDALVLRAEVLSRCRIPFAGFMQQGVLLEESNALLERALSRDPNHLGARFSLGMNHYRSPGFLGRGPDAMEAFETVVEQHGERADPRVATSYELLGVLYAMSGRDAEAAVVWRRGAALFPEHDGLRKRVAALAPPGGGGPARSPAVPEPLPDAGEREAPVYRLEPLVVEAGSYSVDDPRTATRLSELDVYTLPGGTADVMQAFRTVPGVTQVTDGSDLYVRGGDPAEAPIYVDGARLLSPGKFETLNGSLFGVLDPSALERAYFSSGGFSARYGNALSGVVDVRTEGRPSMRYARVGLNLTSLGATGRLPLSARTGAWATGMLTDTRALLAVHGRGGDYPDPPYAIQGMGAVVYEPREGTTLKVSGLTESDETVVLIRALGHEVPFTSRATSRLLTASLRLVNDAGTAGLSLSGGASVRRHHRTFGVLDREARDRGLTARIDGELDRDRVQLRAGLEAAGLEARLDGLVPAGEELVPGSPTLELEGDVRDARHLGAYSEVEGRLTPGLAVIVGLRADLLPGEDRTTLDPRMATAYRVDHWTLRLGGGVFSQGRWRRRPDVLDGATPNGVPLRARHLMVGVQREGTLDLRAEAYLKDYDTYEPDAAASGPVVVDGQARGLDVLVEWEGTGRGGGWVTYSLLDATVELANGTTTAAPYDVTHTVVAVGRLALGAVCELGVTGRYATGRPHTRVLGGEVPGDGGPTRPLYGPLLSARLPDYRRLDVRLTRLVRFSGRSLVLYLEGLNVLDRRNVMGYTYDVGYRNPEPVRAFFSDRTLVLGAEMAF